jgi:hypothetical protein
MSVSGERRARVDQQRLRRARPFLVAHVVEGRRVLAERDDVLVGRLGVVLPRRPEEGEVQLELAGARVAEETPELLVPGGGATIRLRQAGDLIGGLAHAQRIERAHQIGRVDLGDVQRGRRPRIVAHERDPSRRELRRLLHHFERAPEMIALGQSRRFPEALHRRPHQDRPAVRNDDQQTARLGERRPMLEMRRGTERPILIVRVRALQRRARVDDEHIEAGLLQRRGDASRNLLDMRNM